MKKHPCAEVSIAIMRLNDALCTWERNTGYETVLIVHSGYEWPNHYWHRSLNGKPVSNDIPTETLLNIVS